MKEKVLVRGAASVTGTRNYFDSLNFSNQHTYKNPARPGWYFSSFGFGSYRTHIDNNEHTNALQLALTNGINVIDTATNYMDGLSEELVGNVLNKIFIHEHFDRENFIVVSKGGYIQGSLLAELSGNYNLQNKYPGITRYNEQLWHSLEPDFITDQIEASRKRLGLKVIDVFLLHNPEYYVFGKQKLDADNFDPEMTDFLLYQEIKNGFIALEKAVQKKHIQFYGIASNTLTIPKDIPGHIDMNKVLMVAQDAAEAVWGKAESHHFAFIQFPFNLLESRAVFSEDINDDEKVSTLFEFCDHHEIVMLSNRPFNGALGSHIIRLAKPAAPNISDTPIHTEKSFEQFLESENLILHFLEKHKLGHLPVGGNQLKDLLHISPILRQYISNLEDLDQYNQFIFGFVLQKLNMAKNVYVKSLSQMVYKEGVAIFDKYGSAFSFLAENVKIGIIQKMIREIKPIENIINDYLPEKFVNLSLAQKSLMILKSAHPSLIALNGMRQIPYVKEALAIMKIPESLPDITFIQNLTADILKYYHRQE